MRVPTRSAGTRSGVNCRRLKEPPSTSATVLTVSVLARPGTPSSRTWPPASSATSSALEHRLLADDHALDLEQRVLERGVRLTRGGPRSSVLEGAQAPLLRCHVGRLLVAVRRAHRLPAPGPDARRAHLDRTAVAVALDDDLHGIAGLEVSTTWPRVARARERACRRARRSGRRPAGRACRRAAGGDACDDGAVVARRLGGGDAEVGAVDVAVALELRDDLLDGVDRDREADARVRVGRWWRSAS